LLPVAPEIAAPFKVHVNCVQPELAVVAKVVLVLPFAATLVLVLAAGVDVEN
jgi:hypothetical protein